MRAIFRQIIGYQALIDVAIKKYFRLLTKQQTTNNFVNQSFVLFWAHCIFMNKDTYK